MGDLKVAENAAGDRAVGIEVEGAFVPLASIPASRVQHMVERHADLTEKAKGGDENAQKVLDEGFVVAGSSQGEPSSQSVEPEGQSEQVQSGPGGEA